MLLLLIAFLATIGCSQNESVAPAEAQPSTPSEQPTPTVVYLIRHAETTGEGTDPGLSPAGLERVENWSLILQDVEFGSFYSTNLNRTRQTIEPIATSNGQEVIFYDHADFSLADVITDHTGGNVLVVGHSNTIPALINAYLGSAVYPNMSASEFGNLYKITVLDGEVSHEMTVHY
jgi:broad specificity phosphatase PhoE